MEKRLIIAMALSLLIIVTFQHFFAKPIPRQTSTPAAAGSVATVPVTKEIEIKERAADEQFVDEKNSEVETDRYILTFSNIGGAIKSIRLKDHKKVGSNDGFVLAEIVNPKEYIFSLEDPLNNLNLAASPYSLVTKDDVVQYTLKSKDCEVTKKFVLYKSNNIIELQLFIKNTSSSQKTFNYKLVGGSGVIEPHMQDKRFLEVFSKVSGKLIKFRAPRNNIIVNQGNVDWLALKGKYFSIILKPFAQTKDAFYYESKRGLLVSGIESADLVIPSGVVVEQKFLLYAGPGQTKEVREAYAEFDETINYGFFGGISKGLLWLMRFFYKITNSWGISIIFLSLFLNIILFPLSLKSFQSMKKMQELHPHMEKLKVQYKDNAQKLNKEVMELYKKYKINPLSGCLPLILQMPIFISLYNALSRSIELRCASFLWIRDLSMPEAIKIPATLPLIGNSINILPLLMVGAMVIQQKMSSKQMGGAVTEEQKQQQKMMLIIMPVMFGFIFYNMPSGLVLYWFLNTVLTLIEQTMVFKKL